MDVVSALKESKLFSGLNTQEAELLGSSMTEKTFSEGDTVFVEQMPGEALYIILEGTVRVSKMLAEGDEQTLAILGPEDSFGEMALIDNGPRLATARVAENARLASFNRSNFEKISKKYPALGFKFLRNIVKAFSRKVRDNQEEYRQILLWTIGR